MSELDDALKKAFSGDFMDDNGNVCRMKCFSTPEDFLREADKDAATYDRLMYKAGVRIKKFGDTDELAREFIFAANAAKYSMDSNRTVAEMLRTARSKDANTET